jgi:hypothetical protein
MQLIIMGRGSAMQQGCNRAATGTPQHEEGKKEVLGGFFALFTRK